MKMGVLTYHSGYNFGANLQTLATQEALKSRGVHPIIINYQDSNIKEIFRKATSPTQASLHEKFLQDYLNLSPRLASSNEVEEFCLSSLDGILVGSDAVFRLTPKYEARRWLRYLVLKWPMSTYGGVTTQLPPYWLSGTRFLNDTRLFRASFAASASGTKFYLLKVSLYRQLWSSIRRFHALTVRDRWTQVMISALSLGTRIPVLSPDPVFGLRDAFTVPPSEKHKMDVSKTILVSGRYPDHWLRSLTQAARARGFKTANLPNPEDAFANEHFDSKIELPLSPLGWYDLLSRAGGFIGVRFHALVSCLSNGTPFIAVDPQKRHDPLYFCRSRVADLCRRAKVMQRYVTERQIVKCHPSEILATLFDQNTLSNAAAYCENARSALASVIDSLLRQTVQHENN